MKDRWGKKEKKKRKTEESGNCNVKISTRVKGTVMHSVHMKRVCSNIAKDCARKSILVQKHLLIIAYGQIALLMAWLNLVWQVSFVYLTEEKFLFPVWQPECQLSVKESLMTATAVSFIRFSLFEEYPTQVWNTQNQSATHKSGVSVYYVHPQSCILKLEIEVASWTRTHQPINSPDGQVCWLFFHPPAKKKKKMETLFESLKGSSFSIKETKRGGMRKKEGKVRTRKRRKP